LNEPLRGDTYTGGKHIGKFETHCNALTELISKSTYDFDYWVQRGDYYALFKKRFGIDLSKIDKTIRDYRSQIEYDTNTGKWRTDDEINKLVQNKIDGLIVGKTGTEKAFLSCGDSKGAGFSSNLILNIYCPKGTQGLYCEPFSHYGYDVNGCGHMNGSAGRHWNGKDGQSMFGTEAEILLQRGTKFRITKAELLNGHWYVDIEVIGYDIAAI